MKFPEAKGIAISNLVIARTELDTHQAINKRLVENGKPIMPTPHDLYENERVAKRLVDSFPPIFEVGDRVSIKGYSDITPYEVTAVNKSGKRATIREMSAELDPTWKADVSIGGFGGHCKNNDTQRWNITSDSNGRLVDISLRTIKCDPKYNDGLTSVSMWVPVGQKTKLSERPILNNATKFYDYNF